MDKNYHYVWKQKRNIFWARTEKWKYKEIDDDAMWRSIKNACKHNPIENINKNMTIEEAVKHVQEQLQILYINAKYPKLNTK